VESKKKKVVGLIPGRSAGVKMEGWGGGGNVKHLG